MACSKLEARSHLLQKTGTPPKHFSREGMYATAYLFIDANNTLLVVNKPNQHIEIPFFPFKQQLVDWLMNAGLTF